MGSRLSFVSLTPLAFGADKFDGRRQILNQIDFVRHPPTTTSIIQDTRKTIQAQQHIGNVDGKVGADE